MVSNSCKQHNGVDMKKNNNYNMGINIGFDADGVLFDTEYFQLSSKVASYMKRHFGLDAVNVNGYGIKDVFACGENIEMKFWTRHIFYYSLLFRARPGAGETINELKRQGNKVFIVTSKACALEKNYKKVVVRLLFRLSLLLNGIHVDGIEYCSLTNSAQDKLEACRRKNIRVMVEDKKENIERLSEELFVLCFDSRNNQGEYNSNTFRVHNFDEVYANIQRHIGEITNKSNVFTQFTFKSQKEKKILNDTEKEKYYEWLKNYYSQLPFNKKHIVSSENIINHLNRIYVPFFYLKYKPIIIGTENVIYQKGIIFVCNHLCDKDLFLLLYGLYGNGIYWHPLAKKEILFKKIGFLFNLAYSVFVDRSNSSSRHSATQEMAKLLVNGFNVLIFPEGTYNKTNELLKEFSGVSHVYLSQILQKPIVNCALTKDYKSRPVLMLDKPYVVPRKLDIGEAAKDSFLRLSALVEKTKKYQF